MRPSTNYPVKTITAGFIVLVLFSLGLYWVRFFCRMDLIDMMPNYCRTVEITPSGLLPKAIENDPNVVIHSRVTAKLNTADPQFLGITNWYLMIVHPN